LNLARCGAVHLPRDWEWSGYRKMMGHRRRLCLLDIEKVLQMLGDPSLDSEKVSTFRSTN